jgi:hypothetical protein
MRSVELSSGKGSNCLRILWSEALLRVTCGMVLTTSEVYGHTAGLSAGA